MLCEGGGLGKDSFGSRTRYLLMCEQALEEEQETSGQRTLRLCEGSCGVRRTVRGPLWSSRVSEWMEKGVK